MVAWLSGHSLHKAGSSLHFDTRASIEKEAAEDGTQVAIRADYLLAGGTVITVDPERRILRDGAVAFRGADIVAVGKRTELEKTVEAKSVIDCRRKLVMPGFVNSHLHFYHTMHRGLAPENLGGWL
jgi:cytosine/adenosine deaminase-related metal-dependent hydrolase